MGALCDHDRMLIQAPCVVSLVWRVEDTQGNVIDELVDPVEFLVGGDDLLTKIEEVLLDQEAGFTTRVQLEPEHAFGDYNAELVFFEERGQLVEPIEVGMQFDGPPPGALTPGMPTALVYTVTEVYPQHVVLDGNHPLAGMALRLQLTVHAVREASAAEIESGSVGEPAFTVLSGPRPDSALH
jgi:FKBP-type peptidyl-prolyl cis-trans isomerase SlyD